MPGICLNMLFTMNYMYFMCSSWRQRERFSPFKAFPIIPPAALSRLSSRSSGVDRTISWIPKQTRWQAQSKPNLKRWWASSNLRLASSPLKQRGPHCFQTRSQAVCGAYVQKVRGEKWMWHAWFCKIWRRLASLPPKLVKECTFF